MKRIIHVPIEKLEERYSGQWYKWFTNAFEEKRISHITIHPDPLSDKIRDGSFLDVCGTNHFKAMQLAELCRMAYNRELNDDDVIFFVDAWNPAISNLAYIRDGLGMKFKIAGCLFAGSYDPYDFLAKTGMGYWAKDLENSWFRIVDKYFIATEFHKRLIRDSRDVDPKKLIVTGHPTLFDWESEVTDEKENIIVFPHRLDSEKHPELFDKLRGVIPHYSEEKWEFIKTKDVTKTKQEYFELLERAKISVSFADQETWGFAMIESVFAGCLPLVPDKLSYAEMYDPVFKYTGLADAQSKLGAMIYKYDSYLPHLKENRKRLLDWGKNSLDHIITELVKW